MKNYTALLTRLEQQIQQLQEKYTSQQEKILYYPFAPKLFSPQGEPVRFYVKQIQQTFHHLSQLKEPDILQAQFFSEKLLAQYYALQDACELTFGEKKDKSAVPFRTVLNKREKLRQAIDQLPPRERLVKYYESLQLLNEKLNEQKDRLAQNPEMTMLSQQIEITQQRRQRCLDAIEVLEDYLAFKNKQENPQKNQK